MAFDIFKYAEEFDTDYYDPDRCQVYKVQDYNRKKIFGLEPNGIEVTDLDGKYIKTIFKT